MAPNLCKKGLRGPLAFADEYQPQGEYHEEIGTGGTSSFSFSVGSADLPSPASLGSNRDAGNCKPLIWNQEFEV